MTRFAPLFTVYFQHNYFKNQRFNGFAVTPSGDSMHLMRRYGLLTKFFPDRFVVLFESNLAGTEISREQLMAEKFKLIFRLDLTDLLLYNYTDRLPTEVSDSIFRFSNITVEQQLNSNKDSLHQDEFVSQKDAVKMNAPAWPPADLPVPEKDKWPTFNEVYFSKPFGHLEIMLHPQLAETMYIRFSKRSTYWRYLLVSEHLQQWKNLSVVNKITREKFSGPQLLELPDGNSVNSFISDEPIALTQVQNHSFQLVENYDPDNNKFQNEIISVLPNPDINLISKVNGGNNVIKKDIANIVI